MGVYLTLFIEFFKTGLFAIGGGLATLPFLSDMATKYPWFDSRSLIDMIAISQSTPGPLGVNMATYAGFKAGGLLGGVIATIALVMPSIIIIVIIAHFLKKFRESQYVESVFSTLRPVVTALIAVAGFEVVKLSLFYIDKFKVSHAISDLFNIKGIIFFGIFLFLTNKFKKHPIFYIAIGAVVGIIFKM